MAAVGIFLAPTAGLTVAAKKRAENRRRQASANAFSKKYPLVDDVASMQSSIAAADAELKSLKAAPAETAGAKRVKKRNVEMLNKWVLVMKDHRKDLTAGISMATTDVTAPAPVTDVIVPPAPPIVTAAPAPMPVSAVESTEAAAQASAAPEPAKKGTNWLLIGGAVVGVILIVNLLKKN